jgi:uncharacterized protein (DUF1501 family)
MSDHFSRRDLLKWMSAGAGAAAVSGGFVVLGRPSSNGPQQVESKSPDNVRGEEPPSTDGATADSGPPPTLEPIEAPVANSDPASRMLVVIEFNGGNDGLSTFVPYGMSNYYDLRQRTAIAQADVLAIDGEIGLHPSLRSLHARGLAIVEGVGSFSPDESHFAMSERWWAGDAAGNGGYDTGIWGRLADALGDGSAPAVAMSIGAGAHPSMISRKAGTLSLLDPGSAWILAGAEEGDTMRRSFQNSIAAYGKGPLETPLGRARATSALASKFAERLITLPSDDEDGDGVPDSGIAYPGSELGTRLRFTANLLASDQGVRIVHVPIGGFDTHEDHVNLHTILMGDVNDSLEAFFQDLERLGLSDRVVVMTTSEFGRRPEDNESNGLDHGTASSMALFGPVNRGRFGQHPSLTSFAEDDNMIATVGFDQYYATVAEGWFGVPPSELFNEPVETIGGIFV